MIVKTWLSENSTTSPKQPVMQASSAIDEGTVWVALKAEPDLPAREGSRMYRSSLVGTCRGAKVSR